jgi:hypothetical protein
MEQKCRMLHLRKALSSLNPKDTSAPLLREFGTRGFIQHLEIPMGADSNTVFRREKLAAARPGKDEDTAQHILFFANNDYLDRQNLAADGGCTLAAGL